jgi:hypothetical protein
MVEGNVLEDETTLRWVGRGGFCEVAVAENFDCLGHDVTRWLKTKEERKLGLRPERVVLLTCLA